MPSWQEVRDEIEETVSEDAPHGDCDGIRRAKMKAVRDIRQRELLVYATDFMHGLKARAIGPLSSIDASDKDGFDEITSNIRTGEVDVLLHSPGGTAEAAESLVHILRSRCSSVKFIVPSMAKSAATMMAMSADEILMDDVSELGPIDPQMRIPRGDQYIYAPAQAILDQFAQAAAELTKQPQLTPAWLPILHEFGPSLLQECQNALALSEKLVAGWLEQHMFADEPDSTRSRHAKQAAQHLNDHKRWGSHPRRIGIEELRERGIKVLDLREQPDLRDAIRSLHYAIVETFNRTAAYKIFENTAGAALIHIVQIQPAAAETAAPSGTRAKRSKKPKRSKKSRS